MIHNYSVQSDNPRGKKKTENAAPRVAILPPKYDSFLSETIDALRTDLMGVPPTPDVCDCLKRIIEELKAVDTALTKNN